MKRVVITGLGVISPIGNDINTFFNSLKEGVCGIDYITKFDASEYKVKIAAEVKNFDAADYGINRIEARKMDLFTQYALAAAEQAVSDSGILGSVEPERFGAYVGSGVGGMITFVNQAEIFLNKGATRVSPFFIPMLISNMASGMVAIKYNAQGPSLCNVTACATSANSIGEAFRAIKHGYADAIIAGGSEAPITPMGIAGFTNCMALSTRNIPNSSSIPFDKRRDGFVMGEGGAIVILEEYERAVSRGAKIYCEVVGYGNTNDAFHITAPREDAKGATNAIKLALEEANYNYDENVNMYINAHGTSTPLNDKTETLAFKNVFGAKAFNIHISSTKSMTGHTLGAAGGIEAIVSTLAIKHGLIPPTIGYAEKDEQCDLNYTPNKSVNADVQLALSTSFGFGGHNGVLVLKKVV